MLHGPHHGGGHHGGGHHGGGRHHRGGGRGGAYWGGPVYSDPIYIETRDRPCAADLVLALQKAGWDEDRIKAECYRRDQRVGLLGLGALGEAFEVPDVTVLDPAYGPGGGVLLPGTSPDVVITPWGYTPTYDTEGGAPAPKPAAKKPASATVAKVQTYVEGQSSSGSTLLWLGLAAAAFYLISKGGR